MAPFRLSPAVDPRSGYPKTYSGFVRVRLVHMLGRSVLLPDLLFLRSADQLLFFRPSFFSPNQIDFVDRQCKFTVDVAKPKSDDAVRLVIGIAFNGRVHTYPDGAELYCCTIQGPRDLRNHAGGRAREVGGKFFVQLHHFTTSDAADSILRDQRLRSSAWTIQGLRELANVGHVYFTTLPDISVEADLRRIAMASDEEIQFMTTRHTGAEEIVRLRVYRGSTLNRTHRVSLWVPLAMIAPPDLLFHFPPSMLGYYEIVSPEIIRVAVEVGEALTFDADGTVAEDVRTFRFDYVIVGNAQTAAGIAAPFAEADRMSIAHVERLFLGEDVFSFWWRNQNKNLFTGRNPRWRDLR